MLACIQFAAEYENENEVEADLADAVSVVRALITAVAARIDVAFPSDKNAGIEGEGPS